MILILGGTTEGRAAVRVAEAGSAPYYYSTKGDGQEVALTNGRRLTGALDAEAMEAFCREKGIRLLVDAAHPFAEELHRTVARVAGRLPIPVVRYERKYPPRDPLIVWCDTYEAAIERMEAGGVSRLLALTGVQTIRRLAPFWRKHLCWFRILGRDESVALALEQGFPAERLIAALPSEAPDRLIRQLRPDALLTKESGESGYFCEKIKAARAAGIPVFAVKRPALPDWFIRVYGENGLRKAIERLAPGFFRLRSGYTTGACATAAAKAALRALLTGAAQRESTITLPGGEEVTLPVASTVFGAASYAACTVIKDAGDDPDVTHGQAIVASVRLLAGRQAGEPFVLFRGGEGVGTVTLPGLGLEVGGPAINATPRRMIEQALREVLATEKTRPTSPGVCMPPPSQAAPAPEKVSGISSGSGRPYSWQETTVPEKADGSTAGFRQPHNRMEASVPEKTSGIPPGSDIPYLSQEATVPGKAGGMNPGFQPTPTLQEAAAPEKACESTAGHQSPQSRPEAQAPEKSVPSPDACQVEVTISVPGGRAIARRTFNPKLGIEGGISIIGTSGIVCPFSTEAFVASIRKEIEVAAANGVRHLVINSGAKSERFLKARYPELPPQAFVHYGNFIGETLRIAASTAIPEVTMGIMIGKAVKLAEGFLDTHSKNVTVNREFLREIARRAGYPDTLTEAINGTTLARELWNLFPLPAGNRFFSLLTEQCFLHCAPLLPGKKLSILLIDEEGNTIK